MTVKKQPTHVLLRQLRSKIKRPPAYIVLQKPPSCNDIIIAGGYFFVINVKYYKWVDMKLEFNSSQMEKDKKINVRIAVICWFITIGYMGAIFIASAQHGINLPRLPVHFDKIVHMCIYVPLAFLFVISLRKSGVRRFVLIVAFLSAALYGVTDEVHQLFVAGRNASVGDTIADLAGALIGSLSASFLKT